MAHRPNCGGELNVMAAIQTAPFVERIIKLLGAVPDPVAAMLAAGRVSRGGAQPADGARD
jgi:hypothetical protein